MTTKRIPQNKDTEGTIGERVARAIDEAVAARLAANPDLARVLDLDEARDRAVRRIVADYLDDLDRRAARPAATENLDRYDGDGYSVRRLSPDEARRLGLDDDEPTTGAIYYSDDEFQAVLDTIPPADAHV